MATFSANRLSILVSILTLGAAFSASAQTISDRIDVVGPKGGKISFQIGGQGSFVCSAEGSMQGKPVLARGRTLNEAKIHAKQACASINNGDDFFCKVTGCEEDVINGADFKVRISAENSVGSIKINLGGKSNFLCSSRNTMKGETYLVDAPTITEGKALTRLSCYLDNANDSFFCQDTGCEELKSENSASVNVTKDDAKSALDKLRKRISF
jgi:hypothetical protein